MLPLRRLRQPPPLIAKIARADAFEVRGYQSPPAAVSQAAPPSSSVDQQDTCRCQFARRFAMFSAPSKQLRFAPAAVCATVIDAMASRRCQRRCAA